MPLDILFHPITEDHYFVFYQATGTTESTISILAQEYVGNRRRGIYRTKFERDANTSRPIIIDGPSLMTFLGQPRSPKSQENYGTSSGKQYTIPCCHEQDRQESLGNSFRVIETVTFDCFTKTFATRSYRVHDSIKSLTNITDIGSTLVNQACIWQNQLLLPVYISDSAFKGTLAGAEDLLIVAIKPWDRTQNPPNLIPWHVKESSQHDQTLFRRDGPGSRRSGISFCWATRGDFAKEMRLILRPPDIENRFDELMVRADGESIILIGNHGYVVWSFDKIMYPHASVG